MAEYDGRTAWLTLFPMLLFPTLLEEKIGEARRCGARQRLPRHKS